MIRARSSVISGPNPCGRLVRSISRCAPNRASRPMSRIDQAVILALCGGIASARVASTNTSPATRSGCRSAKSRTIRTAPAVSDQDHGIDLVDRFQQGGQVVDDALQRAVGGVLVAASVACAVVGERAGMGADGVLGVAPRG